MSYHSHVTIYLMLEHHLHTRKAEVETIKRKCVLYINTFLYIRMSFAIIYICQSVLHSNLIFTAFYGGQIWLRLFDCLCPSGGGYIHLFLRFPFVSFAGSQKFDVKNESHWNKSRNDEFLNLSSEFFDSKLMIIRYPFIKFTGSICSVNCLAHRKRLLNLIWDRLRSHFFYNHPHLHISEICFTIIALSRWLTAFLFL